MHLNSGKILIVDDSKVARLQLQEYLEPEGYSLDIAENGTKAWEMLRTEPENYISVLLDRIMPCMDGLELLKMIKASEPLKNLPVIMQTGRDAEHEVKEGIDAGAYYYLTKPYTMETVRSITRAAVADFKKYKSLLANLQNNDTSGTDGQKSHYSFRTLGEADVLTKLLSQRCPNPKKVLIGLGELLTNAIEHGNLGITYEEKSELNDEGKWEEEVKRRLTLPEYMDKVAVVEIESLSNEIRFLIKDQGNGFDWKPYLEVSTERAFDNHGRGIAMSKGMSFDWVKFIGIGNEVAAGVAV